MLTDTKLKSMKPKDRLYKVSDRDGLYVAVTKNGTISFRYDYRFNGRRETVTFGKYGPDGITLAQARELLNDAKKQLNAGISPAASKRDGIDKRKGATVLISSPIQRQAKSEILTFLISSPIQRQAKSEILTFLQTSDEFL
ncbi:Arm DNA-binding domain-containing protein, partial [Morganella morganii]|uniref:Arm DNA-binding domain-containing protein n=1 Tax=Morganella morganii TaxID=582 RepID=UPI0032DA0E4D